MKIIKKYITKTKIYNRRLVKSNYFITNFHFIEIVLSKNHTNTFKM